jgi:hypothetical protein
MRVKGFVCAVVVVGLCLVAPAAVPAYLVGPAPKASTVAPSRQQRAAILRAFGLPHAGWPCMTVRLAASNRAYGTVRPLGAKSCARWAFNGMNVIRWWRGSQWRVLFEGSAFACPLSRIPRQVQRDLRVCP